MDPVLEQGITTAVLCGFACLVAEFFQVRSLWVVALVLSDFGPSGGFSAIIVNLVLGAIGRLISMAHKDDK